GVKGLILLLGALGFAGMWAAIFADVGVMVIAIMNAVRALGARDSRANAPALPKSALKSGIHIV
ncbi:MAG: hypothetical protein FWH49_07720, partial [Clostridiales bacterium]|nr:hypothetical protein [Clostridiales bacterium]